MGPHRRDARVGGKPLAHETVVASLNDEPTNREGPEVQIRAAPKPTNKAVSSSIASHRARHASTGSPRHRRAGKPGSLLSARVRRRPPGPDGPRGPGSGGRRPLVGRVVAPDERGRPLDLAGSNAYLLMKVPEVPYPPGLAEGGSARSGSVDGASLRPATAYRHWRRGFAHSLKLQPDGSFRVDEVQPGAYELHVRVKGFSELTRDVTVAEPAAGKTGPPVDLGALTLKRPATPEPGGR